jgi:hypothetical protein
MFILPQVEQTSLFNAINMDFEERESRAFPVVENHTARNTRLAAFLCPSDGEAKHLNSYRFNRGRYGVIRTTYDGPFSFGVLPRPATITDGLSRTAFVSERIAGTFDRDAHDARRDIKSPNPPPVGYPSDTELIPACLTAEPGVWDSTAGRYWFFSGFANTNYDPSVGYLPRHVRQLGVSNGLGLCKEFYLVGARPCAQGGFVPTEYYEAIFPCHLAEVRACCGV